MTCSSHENSLVAGSQFYITLSEEPLDYLNGKHAIFGVVSEGMDVLDKINDVLIDEGGRPFRDIRYFYLQCFILDLRVRIKHTIILDDPYPDPPYLRIPSRSPSPTPEMLASTRIGENEELFPDNISPEEAEKEQAKKDADAQALTLELVGDLPFAEVKPAENVLFVCKLHTVTTDEDLELIFSRFGPILRYTTVNFIFYRLFYLVVKSYEMKKPAIRFVTHLSSLKIKKMLKRYRFLFHYIF